MNKRKNQRVLLIGGRSKAKSMALSLLEQGYQVTAVNSSYEDCVMLAEIDGLSVIHGDGTKPYILDEAGAALADIVIALSGKDTDNLVACQLCKRLYGAKKTVSLLVDPGKTAFFYQMGVDSVVCAVSGITNIIHRQAFVHEMSDIVSFGRGRVQIIEVQIPADAPASGKKLSEIPLPKEAVAGCVLRGADTLIPRGDTRILAGDTLVVIAGSGHEISAVHALTGR